MQNSVIYGYKLMCNSNKLYNSFNNNDFYVRREKNMALAEVIKYEGDNSTFVWKHPVEDFNTNSQLIVHESQEQYFL